VRLALLLIAATLALSSVAFARTAEHQAAVERAERIGRDIYEHDRAAWLGTDALRAEMGDSVGARLRGWITERDGENIAITFVTLDGEAPASIYRAVLRDGALIEQGQVVAPLTAWQTKLYQARQAAMQSEVMRCSQRYNSVTLPSADEQQADVYLIPGTTDASIVLVGGAHRVRVDLADAHVIETQAFSRSCLTLQQGPDARALFFTHLATPLPTETHVFLNLSLGIPLFVGTEQGVWSIEDGRIRFYRERPG
jgi:hypothetical protein